MTPVARATYRNTPAYIGSEEYCACGWTLGNNPDCHYCIKFREVKNV